MCIPFRLTDRIWPLERTRAVPPPRSETCFTEDLALDPPGLVPGPAVLVPVPGLLPGAAGFTPGPAALFPVPEFRAPGAPLAGVAPGLVVPGFVAADLEVPGRGAAFPGRAGAPCAGAAACAGAGGC